jgi:hypothetical protein
LSEFWALSWYGVIPEKTVTFTSVTPRTSRSFDNAWGSFRYRSVKTGLFFGFREELVMGAPVRIAEPEKALLDLWHLEPGEWTAERMESMRFEPGAVDSGRLTEAAARSGMPRLMRAAEAWRAYERDATEGRVEL